MPSNNITRFLDSRKINYEIFELPAEKLGAVETADILHVPISIVYKTIVLNQQNSKPILCIVPGNSEVDLKAVASFLGQKKVRLTTKEEAESLTGLLVGGISPLALIHKGFIMIIDESINQNEYIHISGGERGLNIKILSQDLLNLLNAKIAKIST